MRKWRLRSGNPRLMAVGNLCDEQAGPPLYPQKLALIFADQRRSTLGIVRMPTKSHGVRSFVFVFAVINRRGSNNNSCT
jgi:hypothetical protein